MPKKAGNTSNMPRIFRTFLYRLMALAIFASLATPIVASAQESGLPIPRFVALRSDKVFLRSGPGLRYPKVWIYQRRNMPMEVVSEFDTWRKVRDWEGSEGWVHQSLLVGSRHVIVTDDTITLYSAADENARKIALISANVIGKVEDCPASMNWCQLRFGDFEGWAPRQGFWGLYEDEQVEG
jgi:SH3-like domain-containing protein|tara:strand:+ start:2014 stop:2559 length:546 start_codon:yes stop_codon:yes gene_type:complete